MPAFLAEPDFNHGQIIESGESGYIAGSYRHGEGNFWKLKSEKLITLRNLGDGDLPIRLFRVRKMANRSSPWGARTLI